MSKAPDSDLYEDLYGADESTTSAGHAEPEQPPENDPVAATSKAAVVSTPQESVPKTRSEEQHSIKLEEEPSSAKASSSSPPPAEAEKKTTESAPALSYSAQIAKQFSAYQQTPSQERQQRSSLPANPMTLPSKSDSTPSAIASYESRTENDKPFIPPDRPIRPSEMKDEGKMFIGGLSWDTTDDTLRNYFSQFGRVDASTILRDPDGRSRGFAFLTFEDPASVNAVMCREHVLDGKSIDPKRAIPRSTHLRSQRFFIGGLSPTTTNESLRAFFEQFGKIVDANVMGDRDTGRNKGFGFVTFEDLPEAQVERLVGGGGWEVDGKTVEVKLAQPRSARQQNASGPSGPAAIGTYTSDMRSHSDTPPPNMSGGPAPAPQDMTALYQRLMGQMGGMMGTGMINPMMGTGMGMMGMGGMGMGMGMGINSGGMMNPMMGGGGMAGTMNPMMGGMMGMGMPINRFGGSGMQSGWNGMGDGGGGGGNGAMRLGFGPMSNPNVSAAGGQMGMGMSPMGVVNPTFRGRGGMNGVGPARAMNRGHHNFHPYARG